MPLIGLPEPTDRQKHPGTGMHFSPGTPVYVAASTPPERLAQYEAAGFHPVFPEDFESEVEVRVAGIDRETNPEAYRGWQLGSASRNVWAANTGTPRGTPPTVMELPPQELMVGSQPIPLDRYALRPGGDYFRKALGPNAQFAGPEPTMFAHGDLPHFTASGIDPQQLRWAPWWLRHSAAYTESRALALTIIEQIDLDDSRELQTAGGRDARRRLLRRRPNLGHHTTRHRRRNHRRGSGQHVPTRSPPPTARLSDSQHDQAGSASTSRHVDMARRYRRSRSKVRESGHLSHLKDLTCALPANTPTSMSMINSEGVDDHEGEGPTRSEKSGGGRHTDTAKRSPVYAGRNDVSGPRPLMIMKKAA